MKYEFAPSGVCCKLMVIDVDEAGIVKDVSFMGGCPGNLSGIRQLVKGMKATDISEKLKGIRCGGKPTSCPDQLSIALDEISRA